MEDSKDLYRGIFDEPQLQIHGLWWPDSICPLKDISWTAKALLTIMWNMQTRHINMFVSFTNRELAHALTTSTSTVIRCKKQLVKQGYVSKEGEVLFDVYLR